MRRPGALPLERGDERQGTGDSCPTVACRPSPVAPPLGQSSWPSDTLAALSVFAVLRTGLILRGPPCPAIRDALSAAGVPMRRIPPSIAVERLTGGLDLAETLARGRPVLRPGLLAEFPGAVFVLGAAERWDGPRLGPILAALDEATCGVIACDEGVGDEALPAALAERCALRIELDGLTLPTPDPAAIATARALLPSIAVPDALLDSLCATAAALGVGSLRACLFASRVAAALAALDARAEASPEDAALAARLVLAPRATRLPPAPAEQPEPAPASPASAPEPRDDLPDNQTAQPPDEMILQAALAALPRHLLEQLADGPKPRRGAAGRAGTISTGDRRGRPIGARRARPRDGARLDLVTTLRTAAPWQRLRGWSPGAARLQIRPDDLHVVRCRPRTETTTIFAVDASGSAALARLAEAKGAVELLLADCYVRRDRVAVVAFRGTAATVLLPPTRAPARARRSLAGLPGGGATPLASGIEAATALADASVRRGETPTIVLLTDGQANVASDGTPGRPKALQDALHAASLLRRAGHKCLLIDTANRSQPLARQLADALGARYLALPRADAAGLSGAIRASRAQ
jgi:magnesium chelatase subunit D